MDILMSVEPQLAIPVVCVVVCALLVYIFGFQKTQEPSFQHLAVLKSGSRASNLARQRSSTPQVKNTSNKTSTKTVANGHANQEKASPKPNGTVKTPTKVKDPSNKENVRPQKATPKKEKIPRDTAEDLESGDWIQAPSRKDKKAKKENVLPKSPEKSKLRSNNSIEQVTPTQQVEVVEAPKVEEPVQAPLPAEPVSTPKKDKKKAKESPKVEKSKAPDTPTKVAKTEVKKEVKKEVQEVEVEEENVSPATPIKEVAAQPPKVEETKSADPRSNVAFDEMGDWEEAKSRGNAKKRKARKD